MGPTKTQTHAKTSGRIKEPEPRKGVADQQTGTETNSAGAKKRGAPDQNLCSINQTSTKKVLDTQTKNKTETTTDPGSNIDGGSNKN